MGVESIYEFYGYMGSEHIHDEHRNHSTIATLFTALMERTTAHGLPNLFSAKGRPIQF